nr:hypothetical protein REQ54_01762 [Rhizobium sp. Q54]
MIASSFSRNWPPVRIDRLRALQANARKSGFKLIARNGGNRRVFLAHLSFWKADNLASSFWDIEEAEAWLSQQGADA